MGTLIHYDMSCREWVLCFIRIELQRVGTEIHQDSVIESGYFDSSG